MRSSLLFFVFAGVLVLSQGSAVHSKSSTAVQRSCDFDEITTLVEELEANIVDLATNILTDVNGVIDDGKACVQTFLCNMDVSAFITCGVNVVDSAVNNISYTIQSFENESEYTVGELVKEVKKCFEL